MLFEFSDWCTRPVTSDSYESDVSLITDPIAVKTTSLTLVLLSVLTIGCSKLDQLDESPGLQPLTQGFQASAAIGYCATTATAKRM